jgi:AcrR family transcriptional regulator
VAVDTGRPSLRERKKAATRARILAAAEELFTARGYDAVTVAEIADAADVSVKTLFVYFRSKEDLVFADTSLLDDLVVAVRDRPADVSPARAVGDVLAAALAEPGIEGYHRRAGDAEALRGRLLRLWSEYEDALVAVLSDVPGPHDRLQAIALMGIVRTFTAPEVRQLAATAPDEQAALRSWLAEAVTGVERLAADRPRG